MKQGLVVLVAVVSGFSGVSGVWASSPIEGGSDGARTPVEQALLRSVLTFEVKTPHKGYLCSASYVGKDILMIADHCVTDDQTGEVSVDSKTPIRINGGDQFEVAEVDSTGYMKAALKGVEPAELSDMALVRIRPRVCLPGKMDWPLIPVAGKGTLPGMKKEIMIIGAGISNPYGEDAGQMRIGYNHRASEDEIKSSSFPAQAGTSLDEHFSVPSNSIPIMGNRVDVGVLENKAGLIFNSSQFQTKLYVAENSAIDMHGDSGGPMIGFDSNGNPKVIGVASMTIENVMKSSRIVVIRDGEGNEVEHLPFPEFRDDPEVNRSLMAAFQSSIVKRLNELGYLAGGALVLRDFEMSIQNPRLGVGLYTSITEGANADFLNRSMAKLGRNRDLDPVKCPEPAI